MYKLPTKEERESTALGRFELVCEAYIKIDSDHEPPVEIIESDETQNE